MQTRIQSFPRLSPANYWPMDLVTRLELEELFQSFSIFFRFQCGNTVVWRVAGLVGGL